MSKKFFLFSFSILIILIFIFFLAVGKFNIGKQFVKNYLWHYVPQKTQIILKLIIDDSLINNFKNDYNVKFLPKTQFEDLKFEKVDLSFLKESSSSSNYLGTSNLFSFFIEKKNDNSLIVVSDKAEIYELKNSYIFENNKNKKNFQQLETNINVKKVLDAFILNNEIFLSFVSEGLNCDYFRIMRANLNEKNLNFVDFFAIDECGTVIQGGRMQYYNHNNHDGLLFTTGDNYADSPNGKSQKINSIFGKVIFKPFNDSKYEIFSLGHRNPQGLYVENELILMTEHGPKGGDEINRIVFNKNYGWPIASYGDKYNSTDSFSYKQSHFENGFEEPIYSFIPSIGISEIIKIPNMFSEKWIDNFIISSLFGRSIYRVKFDNNFKKLIYVEIIYIGQRIRDIKYLKYENLILLALEEIGEIGILSNLN